jgi:DNA binding domain, excisionase family
LEVEMKAQSEALTTIDVSRDLNLGRATIHRYIQEGKIPAIKVGKNYRIPLEPYLKFKREFLQQEDPTAPEIHTLMEEWLNHLRFGPRPFSNRTIDDYQYNFLRYLRMVGGCSNLHLLMSKDEARKALESIPIAGYARRCHLVSTLVSFAKFLVDRKLLPESYVDNLRALRPKRFFPPKRTVLEGDQIPEFLAAIWTLNGASLYQRRLNYALVRTLMLTGLRSSELSNLTVSDVDLERRVLSVQMGKGRKFRQIGIGQDLKRVLEEYRSYRPKSLSKNFFLTREGTPLNHKYIASRMRRLSKATGIDVSAHSLRRHFICQSALKGHPLAVISRAVGHSDISVTNEYLVLSQKDIIAETQRW